MVRIVGKKELTMTKDGKKRVLFICVHNSARSQMAEAFLNDLGGDRFAVMSAGLEPGTLNPYVVRAMEEIGYDISGNSTDSVFEIWKSGQIFDFVIAVCSKEAEEKCPIFPGVSHRLHWPFGDPSSQKGSDEEIMAFTRNVRDQIKEAIETFIQEN